MDETLDIRRMKISGKSKTLKDPSIYAMVKRTRALMLISKVINKEAM